MAHEGLNQGFRTTAIPEFRPILENWLLLQDRYLRRWSSQDVAWIYGERASLSVLAAAAWQAGGIALEEFSTEKKRSHSGSAIPVETGAQGRCDLYVNIRGQDFLIEAKPSWPALRGDVASKISDALAFATKEVRRNSTYAGAMRLAAVLIGPHMPRSYIGNSAQLIDGFVTALSSFTHCATAWFFPQSARSFSVGTDRKLYPGAALVIKPLRKRNAA